MLHQTPHTVFAETTALFPGDVNCSGTTDAIDSLQILNFAAGLTTTAADCIQQYGNVNCDASVNVIDSMLVLRYVAELPTDLTQGCPAIGGPPTAERLAHQLQAAPDTASADAVLKLVYEHLGLAVYTKDGQQVQAGAEDFYFYDFESELLAGNYVDEQLYGLDTAALFLNEAGVLNAGGQAMTAADVLSVLTAKVTAARGDDSMFTWRLIDELGLVRADPLDLTNPSLDPAATYLDSVQTFLVLYDMTSPVSAGASTEGLGAADTPDARPRAMHDYSLLAQAYRLVSLAVDPTHWAHGDNIVEREVKLYLEFDPGEQVVEGVTAGPLRGVALPVAGSRVPGAVVDWFPRASLVPQNGIMVYNASSSTTDDDGEVHALFIPRSECPATVGVGQVVRELGMLDVVARVPVTSVSPPYSPLGVIGKRHPIPIYVSHHTGATAQTAGSAPALAAAASLDQLPCAWEGTASATYTESNIAGHVTTTVTASGVRFERDPVQYPGVGVFYRAVAGQVSWTASGSALPDCTYSGSGTYSASANNSSPDPYARDAHILIWEEGGVAPRYDGQGQTFTEMPMALLSCSAGSFEVPASGATSWFYAPVEGGFRLEADGSLKGSFSTGLGPDGDQTTWQWDLHTAECQPSPEPVCQ